MAVMAATSVLALALIAYVLLGAGPRRWKGWLTTGVAVVAWAAWGALLGERALRAGRWPIGTAFESGLWLVWLLLSGYFILERTWRERRAATCVLGIGLAVALALLTTPSESRQVVPLVPSLRSAWLPIHTLCTLVGYAACALAAGLGFSRIAGGRARSGSVATDDVPRLPPADETDYMLERVISLGFPWLCLGVLTGAIMAQSAWGRYWGWDPKETWALITLLWYLAMFHLMPHRRWRGRRMAWLAIIGFCLAMFTFVGVRALTGGALLETLHTY